jgi:ectoine hydroxylase-related dioxygenase (phytanoyl-CoA dioxygenase family)
MTLDDQVEAMNRDGYCIAENAFGPEFCDEVVNALQRIEREYDIRPLNMDFSGRNTVRIFNLLQYDEIFQQIPVSDAFLPIIERYLDPECLLSGYDSSTLGPGEKEQPIHADTWWLDDKRFDFPVMVNTIVALTDFTVENGATRVVPGSHKWSAAEVAYEESDAEYGQVPASQPKGYGDDWTPVPVELRKGSVLVYDFKLLHGAGANRTDQPRPSIISPYVLGWIRQLDAFGYGMPEEKLKSFPPRLRRLVGLECYRGNYGHVNNMSPAEWLWDRKEHQPA